MAERRFRIQGEAGLRPAFVAAWETARKLASETKGGWEIVLRPLKSKRSLEQNRRYHAMLRELAEVAWLDGRQYSKEAWHEWIKQEFIGWEDLPGGRRMGISTTTLSVDEFGDLMTRIEAWAAANGWPLGDGR